MKAGKPLEKPCRSVGACIPMPTSSENKVKCFIISQKIFFLLTHRRTFRQGNFDSLTSLSQYRNMHMKITETRTEEYYTLSNHYHRQLVHGITISLTQIHYLNESPPTFHFKMETISQICNGKVRQNFHLPSLDTF